MKTLNTQAIIDSVVANNFIVQDDHSHGGVSRLSGVGVHTRGDRIHVVALYQNVEYYSINEVYVNEETGLPHLSRTSVGGVIIPKGDLVSAIELFNNKNTNCSITNLTLKK